MKWFLVTVAGKSLMGSRRWKFRWQPQAAHLRDLGSVGVQVGEGMNSPQPSKAWPPMLAAWFFRHSLYTTTVDGGGGWWCGFPFWKDNSFLIDWERGGVSLSGSGIVVVGCFRSIT